MKTLLKVNYGGKLESEGKPKGKDFEVVERKMRTIMKRVVFIT